MKKIFILISFISFLSYGANLKPGLWQVDIKIKKGDKYMDPMAEVKKAMASMPKEQKEMMMKMMKKNSPAMAGISNDSLSACYTKEMMDESKLFASNGASNCATKIIDKTDKVMKMSFSCNDGSKGEANWTIKSDKAYEGLITMTTKDGKKADMKYDMKFLKSDCGDIKPVL